MAYNSELALLEVSDMREIILEKLVVLNGLSKQLLTIIKSKNYDELSETAQRLRLVSIDISQRAIVLRSRTR